MSSNLHTHKGPGTPYTLDLESPRPWEHESNETPGQRLIPAQRTAGILYTRIMRDTVPDYDAALSANSVQNPELAGMPHTDAMLREVEEVIDALKTLIAGKRYPAFGLKHAVKAGGTE